MGSTAANEAKHSNWPNWLAVVGALTLLTGFAWPQIADPRDSWTEEKAREYTDASAALHQAAHSHDEDHAHEGHDHAHELEAAKERFEQIRRQLEATREQPQNISFLLKFAGGVLVSVGAFGLMMQRAG